eukprot:NODE_4614_length_785_cov_22.474185_g4271_i0.p2 GENE.NODE_4614_length_785_cov_22.474185_g4271_i0~~NODE_4614_length_785_cov_22.474185_g4271_i0.p2  ORF type:complete len:110 (+),score=16.74 NODE_4614_length_785_cov_22.474185_g4271_i0:251-580(+)
MVESRNAVGLQSREFSFPSALSSFRPLVRLLEPPTHQPLVLSLSLSLWEFSTFPHPSSIAANLCQAPPGIIIIITIITHHHSSSFQRALLSCLSPFQSIFAGLHHHCLQ